MVNIYKKLQPTLFVKENLKSTVGIISFSFVLICLFIFTRGVNPSVSELAFVEHSTKASGSVVPASCDSSPPMSHFAGDCNPGGSMVFTVNVNPVPYGQTYTIRYDAYSILGIAYCSPTLNGAYYGGGGVWPVASAEIGTFGPISTNDVWTGTCHDTAGNVFDATPLTVVASPPPSPSTEIHFQ